MADAGGGAESELALTLLGEPALRLRGTAIRIPNRKLMCMLAYLALNPDGRETRERLTGLLWSESDEKLARGSLRQAISAFRKVAAELGYEGFATDRAAVGLDLGALKVDVAEVEAHCAPGDLHPALLDMDDLPSRLMQGCEDADPAFAAWLPVQREALRDRLLRRLGQALAGLEPGAPGAEDVARAVLKLDPTQEEAARHLMTSRALAGDTAGAIRVYDRLWQVLGDDYDMEPSERTAGLVAEIKSGAFESRAALTRPMPPAPAARGLAEAPAARLSRLPGPSKTPPVLLIEGFTLVPGADSGGKAMLAGFRHALIASLVRFREWRVADAGRGATAEAPGGAADRFRVRAEAQAGRAGALNVVLTIMEEATGLFVWSDVFELTPETWAETQNRLIKQVTIALNISLSADRLRRTAQAPVLSASLYDRWLEGQRLILDFSPEAWVEAERLFREVTEAAPDFAPAWSSRAQIGNTRHIAQPGVMRSLRAHRETAELAQRGVALDPLDSRAQLALGWSLAFSGRWEQAELNFELAFQLNGHDAWTLTSVAQAWAFAGRYAEARRLATSALEATPLPNLTRWGYHAGIRTLCGDDAGALEAARIAGDSHANNGMWRAAALARLDRVEEAKAEAEACLEVLESRWRGAGPFTPQAATRWLLHLFPIRREPDWERLRQGLAMAGLPVEDAFFGDLPE